MKEALINDINSTLISKRINENTDLITALNHRELFYCFYCIRNKYHYSVDFLKDRSINEIIANFEKSNVKDSK